MALTAKQERFVAEYLVDLNATQAARRAGYSEKTAHTIGHENLSKPEIATAIAEAQAERAKRTEITQDMVMRELAKIGFSDLRRVLTPGGHIMDPQDWDDDTAGAVASVEVVARRNEGKDQDAVEFVHKFRAWDKLSALEKIGKHLGMFDGGDSGAGSDVADALREIAGSLKG